MTDYQHDEPRTDAEVPFLTGSSEPTGEAPAFEPLASTPSVGCDDALVRLAGEVRDLYERGQSAYSELADVPESDERHAAIDDRAKVLDGALLTRLSIASLVRSQTTAGLVGKARVALEARNLFETCSISEATPLLISLAEDAVRLSGATPRELWDPVDAALINMAHEVERLSALNDAAWNADPQLSDDDPAQIAWREGAEQASDDFEAAVSSLAALEAITPAGMAAKAAALPALTSFWDLVRDWVEADLLRSVAADTLRIGAGQAPQRGQDAALLSLGRYFEAQWRQEREVIKRTDDDDLINTEIDRTEDLVSRIRDLPATSVAGWKVKARAIAWACEGDFSGERPVNVRLVQSLVRDLGALDGLEQEDDRRPALKNIRLADAELLALQKPFLAAWAAERIVLAKYKGVQGVEADEACDVASDAVAVIRCQIEALPATTLEGLKVKVLALAQIYPDEEITAGTLSHGQGATTDVRLISQIIRDLRAMIIEPPAAPTKEDERTSVEVEQAA